MAQLKRGDHVSVALDSGEYAGTVQPGIFQEYVNGGRYAYVDVRSASTGYYRSRRVKAGNVNTETRVAPVKRYEDLFKGDD